MSDNCRSAVLRPAIAPFVCHHIWSIVSTEVDADETCCVRLQGLDTKFSFHLLLLAGPRAVCWSWMSARYGVSTPHSRRSARGTQRSARIAALSCQVGAVKVSPAAGRVGG
jgi:hypothetical protein